MYVADCSCMANRLQRYIAWSETCHDSSMSLQDAVHSHNFRGFFFTVAQTVQPIKLTVAMHHTAFVPFSWVLITDNTNRILTVHWYLLIQAFLQALQLYSWDLQ